MAGSKHMIVGSRHFAEVTPARTPGPLGVNDDADPNVRLCMAGDTPGPLGITDAGHMDGPALTETTRESRTGGGTALA